MTLATKRPALVALLAAAAINAACGDNPTAPKLDPGLTITAGAGTADSVQATPAQALTVLVVGANGKPASGTPVTFQSVNLGQVGIPSMLAGPAAGGVFAPVITDTTDAEGVAAVRVRFGTVAGSGKLTVSVPSLGYQDTARYTVTPGAPARVVMAPRDTFVLMDASVTLRPSITDRLGNVRPDAPTLTASAGVTVSGNTVTTPNFGSHRVRAEFPGLSPDSAAIVALPRGRIAGTTAAYVRTLVMMDLDGGNRTTVSLPAPISRLDWAPDGRIVAGAGEISGKQTLYAVSSTGQVTPLYPDSTTDSRGYPVFSGDGRYLFFLGRPAGGFSYSSRVWRANADGTNPQPTSIVMEEIWGTAYGPSPDGSRVAYLNSSFNLSMSQATMLTESRMASWSWSPLGDLVAFNSNSVTGVVKPDGTGQRIFSSTFTGVGDQNIDWSGDGKYIVFRTSGSKMVILEVATGARAVLPFPGETSLGTLK
ncbi:MAG TPA: hypothetical protein VF584_06935 [Longimicrobium sp.]